MLKINNLDWKLSLIFFAIFCTLCTSAFAAFAFVYEVLVVGIIIVLFGPIIGLTILVVQWPETIIMDEEKVVVYRWRKEISRISWKNVIEVFREEMKYPHRMNCYYYFSDGYDRFLSGKEGNGHFVVFRCPRAKEILFYRFTKLRIKELDRGN